MNQQGHHWPEAWLYGRSSMCSPDDAQPWTLFEELKWPCPSKIHALPEERRLPEVRAGDTVNCLGKMWTHTSIPAPIVASGLTSSVSRRRNNSAPAASWRVDGTPSWRSRMGS